MIFYKHKPKIKFHTGKEMLAIAPKPVPAAKLMPKWFKKIKPERNTGDIVEGTIKRCMPVLDAVSQGYIIPLWADLHVKVSNMCNFKDAEGNIIHSEANDFPEKLIGEQTDNTKETIHSYDITDELAVWVKFPANIIDNEPLELGSHAWEQVGESCDLKKFKLGRVLMKLSNPWVIETSPGYSVQIKNPSSNWENEIQLIEGVVDTDDYYTNINFPFVWTGKEVGDFVIPQGTPIAQVIPFKREKYDLEVGLLNKEKQLHVSQKLSSKLINRYKELFWHKRR